MSLRWLLSPLLIILPASFQSWAASPCGSLAGTRFNLEPRANPQPQNQTSVDFLPGAGLFGADLIVGTANDMRQLTSGSATPPDYRGILGITSQTGYYVHRNGSDSNPCAPDFEGGFGPVVDSATGNLMVGVGYSAVAADPARQAFFAVDTRAANGEGLESAIGLFRNTAANLTDSAACPGGTLTEAQSAVCWPQVKLVNRGSTVQFWNMSPSLAVDERPVSAGAGAGNVYVSATSTGEVQGTFHSSIVLVACTNDLSSCSPAVTVSGSDLADLSNLAVRPDGGVTATYTIYSGFPETAPSVDIKYVACTPHGAPSALTCSAPVLIKSETQAIPFDPFNPHSGTEAAQFVLHTFPKHAHRQDTNGIETYVVWDRCKVSTAIQYPGLTLVDVCPDTDLVMAASIDNGATWQFADLDTGPQDQFQAWVRTDPATNIVNIVYYSSQHDYFQHRPQVLLRQIPPGGATPDPAGSAQILTTLPMEPNGDFVLQGIFIGDYPGVAARGSRAYVHYTHTAVPGVYEGIADPEQNNFLTRFDY